MIRWPLALLSVEGALQPMSRFSVLYCAMPDVGAVIHSVEAVDAFEAEQVGQQRFPGAITASLSPSMTDQGEVRRLFVDWLRRI